MILSNAVKTTVIICIVLGKPQEVKQPNWDLVSEHTKKLNQCTIVSGIHHSERLKLADTTVCSSHFIVVL